MEPSHWIQLLGLAASLALAGVTSVWGFSGFLNRQFIATRQLIDEKIEKLETNILHKLEYHERHDDARFSEIKNDVWEIKIRNAARDGVQLVRKDNGSKSDSSI